MNTRRINKDSPLYNPFSVGFDKTFEELFKLTGASGYPPYNIVKKDENHYVIEMAVAGFGKSDLDIEIEGNKLRISGNITSDTKNPFEYLYQGIASRNFNREFTIADNIEIEDASLVNGMLKVALERFVPEDKKPKKVDINDGETSREFLAE